MSNVSKEKSTIFQTILSSPGMSGDFADIDPPFSLQIDPPKLTAKNAFKKVVIRDLK